jgi:hypothetical protein
MTLISLRLPSFDCEVPPFARDDFGAASVILLSKEPRVLFYLGSESWKPKGPRTNASFSS